MTKFPDPIRSRLPSGENRFSLVDPLVASYLEFVAERTRPNTFDGPRSVDICGAKWLLSHETLSLLTCSFVNLIHDLDQIKFAFALFGTQRAPLQIPAADHEVPLVRVSRW
jgi:hypothetical protein